MELGFVTVYPAIEATTMEATVSETPTFHALGRMERYKQRILAARPRICCERAVFVTESFKMHECEEAALKRAAALRHVLANMSIYILDEELIVGNQACVPRAAPVFPEYSVRWLEEEIDSLADRPSDKFEVDQQTKKELRRVFEYWRGRTHYERVYAALPTVVKEAEEVRAIWSEHLRNDGDGHLIVDYEKVIRLGLRSLEDEAARALSRLDLSEPDSVSRRLFLQSIPVVCEAAKSFSGRLSALAAQSAKSALDAARTSELLRIAEICNRVPYEPARTFYEALQSVWFVHLFLQIESNGHSISLGRFDQYLFPFYQKDKSEGRITPEGALQLLADFWLKMNTVNKVRPWSDTQFITGYPMFQNLTIGGQTAEGRDATNELTYLCLAATREVGLAQPSLSARYHHGSPEGYLKECVQTFKMGLGMPAMFNDEVIVPALMNRKVCREDAYNYAMVGCVEVAVPGKWGYRCNGMSYFSMLKVFELAMNDGRDQKTGKQLCKGTGILEEFRSFEDVAEAFEKQVRFYTRLYITHDMIADHMTERYLPDPFCSMLVADCIQRGKMLKEGGAIYDLVSAQSIGLANVANSLASIKKLVFEDHRFSLIELRDALKSNFESEDGKRIRRIILAEAPRYGNDDDYVDLICAKLFTDYARYLESFKNTRSGRGPESSGWMVSTSTVSANIPFGRFVGPTPDGRRDGQPLADGCSPAQGTDCSGPTAAMNSVTKLPNVLASGGQLFNMKLHPDLLKSEKGEKALIGLLRVFSMKKGWHVQFNVVNADTLRDAQRNPEKHRNLVIRVAGYSAYFVDLDRDLQDDIISRTEHASL
jgi:pyruvate formate-lyase/glycerol dehydratase family glycyl radical enzyme